MWKRLHINKTLSRVVILILLCLVVKWVKIIFTGFTMIPADDFGFINSLRGVSLRELGVLWRTDWGWYYRPVFLTYFWGMLKIFGTNPHIFHLVGVLLHILNGVLLGFFVLGLTQNKNIAIITSLLFWCIPVHQGTVGWISANSALLATFFYLITCHLFMFIIEKADMGLIPLLLLSQFLAFCSKEDALSLVFVLILLFLLSVKMDRIGISRRCLTLTLLFFAMIGVMVLYLRLDFLAYLHILRAGGAGTKELIIPGLGKIIHLLTRYSTTGTLNIFDFYPPWVTTLVCFVPLLMALMWRDEILAFVWFWTLLSFCPVALAFGIDGVVASRFYYLPMCAISSLLASVICKTMQKGINDVTSFMIVLVFNRLLNTYTGDWFNSCILTVVIIVLSIAIVALGLGNKKIAIASSIVGALHPAMIFIPQSLMLLISMIVLFVITWLLVSATKEKQGWIVVVSFCVAVALYGATVASILSTIVTFAFLCCLYRYFFAIRKL